MRTSCIVTFALVLTLLNVLNAGAAADRPGSRSWAPADVLPTRVSGASSRRSRT